MKLSKLKFLKKEGRKKSWHWLVLGIGGLGSIFLLALLILGATFFLTPWQTVVLLQNSAEIRATGGFLGSLIKLEHQGATIRQQDYFDIYDLDAQIGEFPEAPGGMREYLTGGLNRLHLQDANWERDFPTSARLINQLVTQASGWDKADFVVAVNSRLLENFLTEFGGMSLETAHGQVWLTAENFNREARIDHEIFNPEREAKTVFLKNLAQKLEARIRALSWGEKLALVGFLWQQVQAREIQVYSEHPFYQRLLIFLGAAGRTTQAWGCQEIYVVESNVSINKSNAQVTSEIELERGKAAATLRVKFINNNLLDESAPVTKRLHYGNYQRLLLPPGVTAGEVTFNGEAVTVIDEREIEDSSGNRWREIGFLVVVNEQSEARLSVELKGKGDCWRVKR